MAMRVEILLMGEPTRFLGWEINRDRSEKSLKVTQTRFTEELLARFGMANANPQATPMDAERSLKRDS
jgi:hypothetical protein